MAQRRVGGIVDLITNQLIAGIKTFTGQTVNSNSTASTSTTTGALTVPNGGVGIGGNLNVGGNIITPTQAAGDSSTKVATTAFVATALTNFPEFRMTGNVVSSSITTPTNVVYNTVEVDNSSACNATNGTFTAPTAGLYSFTCSLIVNNTAGAANNIFGLLRVNGVTKQQFMYRTFASGESFLFCGTAPLRLNAGDVVTIQVNPTGAMTYGTAGNSNQNIFSGYKIRN